MSEIYRLRLDHFIENDGNRYPLDEPLVIQITFDRTDHMPVQICLNDMLDKMRGELLNRWEHEKD